MKQTLGNYLRAGYLLMQVVTHEEVRAQEQIADLARETKRPLYIWSCTSGLTKPMITDIDQNAEVRADVNTPMKVLHLLRDELPDKCILVMQDFHALLRQPNPPLVRMIRDTIRDIEPRGKIIILVGCDKVVPAEIEKDISFINLDLPNRDELARLFADVSTWVGGGTMTETADSDIAQQMANAATGMTHGEAKNAFCLSVASKGVWDPEIVFSEKCQAVKRTDLLEVIDSNQELNSIGGLNNLKAYIRRRRNAYSDEARQAGLPLPKGLLLSGIPGTGKSLTAKVIAKGLKCPCLRLDVGKLYAGLVGQSEGNLRSVIQTAEAVAPCVLFIDELEKGFSGAANSGGRDGGTSSRVFGSFLTWLQEKTSPVYVVATANDVSALPPEFLRKGRFDEFWFLDLPNHVERAEIWQIMLERYLDSEQLDSLSLNDLVKMSTKMTGAEIEQAVIDAMWLAFDEREPVDAMHLSAALDTIVPMSQTMDDQINALRRWAEGRARMATSQIATKTRSKRTLEVLT